jgi:hypothetical protein
MPKDRHSRREESSRRHHKRSPSESSSSSSRSRSPSPSRSPSVSDSASHSPSGSPSASRSPSPSPPPKVAPKKEVKKRAKTAYQYFCDEQRPKLQRKNPEWRLPQLSKELGAMWKGMTDRKKAKYVRMAGGAPAGKTAGKSAV